MPAKRSSTKKTVTLRLPTELVDDLRALCRDYAGKPYYLSVTTFIEDAISKQLASLKRQIEGDLSATSPAPENSVSPRR
jgi:predicted DNA-binding protein